MKKAQIIHNPTAGDGNHTREQLDELAMNAGYETEYTSKDEEEWGNFSAPNPDAYILAGGDGTVHKLAGILKERPAKKEIPVYLLPLGTANNIARTLGITEVAIKGSKLPVKSFDSGKIKGLKNEDFFLESVGFGIFPQLIIEMKKNRVENETTAEKLKRTIEVLLGIVKEYKAKKAKIKAGDISIKGSFLLVEVMNIPYIGPNLKFAPNADPWDGYLDLILIPENRREDLRQYLEKLLEDHSKLPDINRFVKNMKVQKVKLKWKGAIVHVDDNLQDYSGKSFKLKAKPGELNFFLPG